MTFKEQNKSIASLLDNKRLTIKTDEYENNVYFRPNPAIIVGIKQNTTGMNYLFIKQIGEENEIVQYFYDTVEAICKDFITIAAAIQVFKSETLEDIYLKNLYPKHKMSSSYVRELEHFIISLTNRRPFSRINISFYAKPIENENIFPKKNIAIYKEMEDKDFILTSSRITKYTRQLEEIAKQLLTDGQEPKNMSKIELLASQLIATAKYCEDVSELEALEDKLTETVKVSTSEELTSSDALMEIYSQAKDNFDTDSKEETNENGLRRNFLQKILVEITYVLCDGNKPAIVNALKDIALRPETEKALDNIIKAAEFLDTLASVVASKRDGKKISQDDLNKIFLKMENLKLNKEIKNLKDYKKIH